VNAVGNANPVADVAGQKKTGILLFKRIYGFQFFFRLKSILRNGVIVAEYFQ
jgi:hypothetical protein